PALATDIGIEVRIAVCNDVEPCHLLLVEIERHRIDILLAELVVHHRIKKAAGAEILGVPAGTWQRARNCRRQHDVFGSTKHDRHLPRGLLVVDRSVCLPRAAWKWFFYSCRQAMDKSRNAAHLSWAIFMLCQNVCYSC